jgi:hypothetical protein
MHARVMELNDLALTAPDAAVIDQLEDLAVERGRETLRASLQQAVQKRIDAAEKRVPIRPCGCGHKRENRGKGKRQRTTCLLRKPGAPRTLNSTAWGNPAGPDRRNRRLA